MTLSQTSSSSPRDRRQRVQGAATGVAVLKGLAELGGRASLSALARALDVAPAKVHRYVISLVEAGLVAQDPVSQHYYLGPEVIHLGLVALRLADPVRLAEAPLMQLRDSLGLTCFLAILGNRGPTIVRFEEPALPVTLNVRVGSVMAWLTSATGQVFLADLEASAVSRWVADELAALSPRQRAGLPQPDPVAAIRQTVRQHGVAVVRDTYLPGIGAVAAPVRDVAGRVVAALTVLGSGDSIDLTLTGPVVTALRAQALGVSTALGWRQP